MSESAIPEVRQDLTLYAAGNDADGVPIWHLHDPLANKFFRLEERDVQILALIGQRSAQRITELANSLFTTKTSEEEVDELVEFLRLNNLVVADPTQQAYYQMQIAKGGERDWWQLLLRNPLFFRVPLWNPDAFLDRTLPYVQWMGSAVTRWAFMVLAILAVYLVSRQVDEFLATFLHFFSWSGLAVYFLTLLIVKILHEFGHAYTAKAAGCRVPVIGVAFLVGWPVLYTDTSDAWKIPERRKRLAIGAAGVSVEMAIAVLSLFLWSVSPEGSLKSAFFLLATTTWLLSILVNFNPFMRFDGYYLLSDLIELPNLEKRSFAMARWWLREKLFGFGVSSPEPYRRWLVLFAFGVWLYRFFLFLGIALLVYGFFFKAAGIALFLAEVTLLILRPIYREMTEWWKMRSQIKINGALLRSLLFVSVVGGLIFIPWMNDVTAAGVLQSRHSDIYLPEAGRIVRVPDSTYISETTPLFELTSPGLDHDLKLVQERYRELSRAQASLGFDERLRSQAMVVQSELRTQNQRLRGLMDKRAQLTITAPFDGHLVDLAPDINVGDWLPKGLKIETVVDRQSRILTAYLREEDLARIEAGMEGNFYPENPEFGVRQVRIREIDLVGTTELNQLYLASLFGGDIAVRESETGELSTVRSYYQIKLDLMDDGPVSQVVRGTVVINGRRASLFGQIKRRFVAVFLRETGF